MSKFQTMCKINKHKLQGFFIWRLIILVLNVLKGKIKLLTDLKSYV